MTRSLQLIFSTLAILAFLPCHGQDEEDSTRLQVRTGLALYIDYGKLATITSDFERKLEGGIAVHLANRISPNVQVGWGRLNPQNAFENGEYESTGYYGRFGINYLLPFDNFNTFSLGVKYGLSFFDDEGSYEIASEIFDTYAVEFGETGQSATWFEVVFGSEKKLNNDHFVVGGQFALRILNSRDKFTPVDTYAIPGYGRTFDKTVPAVNLYLKYFL